MKSVRIFYTKGGRMRFVSHLDMTRFMIRMLRKAGLPIWYTEGFHPHAYVTFALPLSLGFESRCEIMDIRLEDDSYPIDTICDSLNAVFPEYVHAYAVSEPVQKVGKIAAARFDIAFSDNGALRASLAQFLTLPEINCTKKTKSGAEKQIDLKQKMRNVSLNEQGDTVLTLTLPAGGQDNVNPELLCDAYFATADSYYPYIITRTAVLDADGKDFK